jgi:hypothetical protein
LNVTNWRMSIKSGFSDLWRGAVRDWKKLIAVAFVMFSGLFTLASAIDFFMPTIKLKTPVLLGIVTLISVVFGLRTVWKPSKVVLQISNCATCLEIVFGDLFAQDGIRAIAVNEYFDSKIGRPVSPRSLHGLLITQCFGGHPQPFDNQLITQLAGFSSSVEPLKVEGKNIKYDIGTTAVVHANTDQYLLFALTTSDPITCKATADVTMLWNAVNSLWKRARNECNNLPLNVPLIGSGPSGLGLPTRDLLNLIILSAITETKAREITKRIRIVLHRDRFDDIDLRDVKTYWKDK